MSCFPCFQNKDEAVVEEKSDVPIAQPTTFTPPPATPPVNNSNQNPLDDVRNAAEVEDNTVKSFTFREIATTTKNFRHEFLLGEGGYGKLFKGTLAATGQAVAVRQLERNTQGNNFVFEISTLSLIRHPNLVKMVGYCADGEQRFLVYEYLPSGSLKNFLFEPPEGEKPLDWTQRMKIAVGVAEALEYLHEKADPTVIYRDLRSSNILLTETKVPKLSDYGLAKLVQGGNKMHMSVMTGFNGYCAPEFENNGDVTVKSDVYSFGVVLLELITGRKALDTSLPADEQSLVSWAQPLFKDPSKYPDMADPRLKKGFPVTGLNQAVGIAAMCLQEEPIARPLISDISAAISFLAMAPPVMPVHDPEPIPASQDDKAGHKEGETSSSSEEEEAEEEDDVRNHNHNRNQDEQPDYSLEEFIKYSSDEEEAHNESNADNKKSMKMQSRTDSRRNNKKSMKIKSRTDSRNATATNKTQTPLDSSSSSADEPPPPPPPIQPPHDEQDQDESSSSDEENWDGREGGSSPKDHDALLPHSSSVESEDEAT